MELTSMWMFMTKARTEFRSLMRRIGWDYRGYESSVKRFLKRKMDECCSQFEEDTLIENLAEEYKLYLKQLVLEDEQGE